MINKQKMWFLTLFTLILVLSVYYITMPSDLLTTINIDDITVTETDSFSVLKEEYEEEYESNIKELEKTIASGDSTIDEVNIAYETMSNLKDEKTKISFLENKLKNDYDLDSIITIKDNKIKVILSNKENSYELANNIIRSVQEEFTEEKDIVVQFK